MKHRHTMICNSTLRRQSQEKHRNCKANLVYKARSGFKYLPLFKVKHQSLPGPATEIHNELSCTEVWGGHCPDTVSQDSPSSALGNETAENPVSYSELPSSLIHYKEPPSGMMVLGQDPNTHPGGRSKRVLNSRPTWATQQDLYP